MRKIINISTLLILLIAVAFLIAGGVKLVYELVEFDNHSYTFEEVWHPYGLEFEQNQKTAADAEAHRLYTKLYGDNYASLADEYAALVKYVNDASADNETKEEIRKFIKNNHLGNRVLYVALFQLDPDVGKAYEATYSFLGNGWNLSAPLDYLEASEIKIWVIKQESALRKTIPAVIWNLEINGIPVNLNRGEKAKADKIWKAFESMELLPEQGGWR